MVHVLQKAQKNRSVSVSFIFAIHTTQLYEAAAKTNLAAQKKRAKMREKGILGHLLFVWPD